MSRRIRRLSMLPTCAGLLIGLSAVACSDKRDDTNTASEISTTTPADGTADTAVATTSQGGNVTASEPAVTTETTAPRATRRSSSSARVDASADVSANDPYAPDVSREPSRTTPAEINAEARVDVNRAEPVDATRNDPALAPSESRADATVRAEVTAPRAEVTAPRAEVTATTPRADVSAPSVDAERRNDSVSVSVTPPRAEVSSPRVNVEPRRDSASVSVTAPRAEITATTPSTTPAPRAEITATTPRAEITTTTPAPSASASSSTPAVSSNPDAPLVPVGPAAKGWMNDPQLINVLLLANSGDSARAMEVIAPNGDVAAAEKDKDVTTTTASLGGTVAAPRTRIVRKDTTDIWPPRNMHDDPRPRTRTIEVEVPVEEPRAAVSASAAVNPVTPGVSIAVDPSTGAAVISMAAVRAFAEQMARDHTATNARLAALVVEDNVAPAESEKSIEVFNNNRAAATTRRPVTDDASARAWLEREVRAHEQALDNIDRQMLPLAADAELRVILEETKRTIQSHLTQARQLLGTAGSVTPTPAPKAGLDSATPMPGMRHPAMTDSMRIRTDSMRTRPDSLRPRSDSMPAPRTMPADSARPRPESTPAQPTQPYPY